MTVSKNYFFVSVVLLLFSIKSNAQSLTNARQHFISTKSDTVHIDTVSVIPGTFFMVNDSGNFIDTTVYKIDFAHALLLWNKSNS